MRKALDWLIAYLLLAALCVAGWLSVILREERNLPSISEWED